MSVTVEKISKHYTKFIESAYDICKDRELAKDLVQEMFIKLIAIEKKEGDLSRLSYKDEINFYFCYRILMSIFIDAYRRKNSYDTQVHYFDPNDIKEQTAKDLGEVVAVENEFEVARQELNSHIDNILDTEHWADALIFKEYMASDKTMRELADDIGISAGTISNSIKRVKESIKDKADYGKIEKYYEKKRQAEEGRSKA